MPSNAQITLRIGRRVLRVATLAEASARYATERDRTGLGASGFPPGEVTTPGGETLLVSYNGRIWRGKGPDSALVFDPVGENARS
jgi:hypothetical protein